MEEKNTIQYMPTMTCNNVVLVATDAALNAVQNTMEYIRKEDYHLYKRMARAALKAALATLGDD